MVLFYSLAFLLFVMCWWSGPLLFPCTPFICHVLVEWSSFIPLHSLYLSCAGRVVLFYSLAFLLFVMCWWSGPLLFPCIPFICHVLVEWSSFILRSYESSEFLRRYLNLCIDHFRSYQQNYSNFMLRGRVTHDGMCNVFES